MGVELLEAQRLSDAARAEMRASRRHRRRARKYLEQLQTLTDEAARRGVVITINRQDHSQEGPSGNSNSTPNRST